MHPIIISTYGRPIKGGYREKKDPNYLVALGMVYTYFIAL